MIAITGASGHLGKATIEFLLKKVHAENIVAVVRDARKVDDLAARGVQVRVADYNNPTSLNNAFAGVQKLLQVSAQSMGQQGIREEVNVVEAAVRQGVPYTCYTSVLKPPPQALFMATRQCVTTEKAIKSSGMSYTFFGNSLYMETIPQFIGNALQDGQIFLSAGQQKISFVYRPDIAEALANVLSSEGHQNKRYEITGTEAYSFAEVAALLKTVAGNNIIYNDIPNEALHTALKPTGMSEEEIDWFLSLNKSIRAGEFAYVSNHLEWLLQRRPTGIKQYIKNLLPQ